MKNKGKRSHFCGIPEETPGDGCPSRRSSQGRQPQGKTRAGALFAKTKGTPHLQNICFQNIPSFDASGYSPEFRTQTGPPPPITYPILPPPSFLEVPLLPARYKQMSGGMRQAEAESEREKYQSVGQVVGWGYPLWGLPHEAWHSSKSDSNESLQGVEARRLRSI